MSRSDSKGLFQSSLSWMFCFASKVSRLFATCFFVPRVLSTVVNIYRVSPVLWEQRRVSQTERIARMGEKERKRNGTVPSLYCIRFPFLLVLPSSRPDFTIGTHCRPILHFIPRGWVASRGARTILLDVTSTLFLPCETLDPSSSPRLFRSDGKGLQMAAISACIDSWNWEDFLVSAELSHPHRF